MSYIKSTQSILDLFKFNDTCVFNLHKSKNFVCVFILLVTLFTITSFNINAFTEISLNNAFLLEGTGYALTKDVIKNSEINLSLYAHGQNGSNVISTIETGFITLMMKVS